MNTPTTASLDEKKLARYLEAHVPGFRGPLTAKKFTGGQSNPTFLIEAASGRYVLRRKPPGPVLKSAHAVDREFRVISALAATDVPVARALHLCTDDDVIGSMFYVMSFVDGRIFWDAALPELDRTERPAVYDAINRSLAALHSVDVDAVGLSDFGKPGNYFERQIAIWTRQYQLSATEVIPEMDRLIETLPALTPPDDGRVCLLHGDYRLDNMIFRNDALEIAALIDWELSTLGHPMADLAYYCMSLRMPGHGDMKGAGNMKGLGSRDRADLNIPSEEAFIEQYCRRTGQGRIDHWPFYMAFSYFRLAGILQGVMKRALDGNASSQRALEVGSMTRPMAEMAVAILEEDRASPAT